MPVYVRTNIGAVGFGIDHVQGFDVSVYEVLTEIETAIPGNRSTKIETAEALRRLLGFPLEDQDGFAATGRILKKRCMTADGMKGAWITANNSEVDTSKNDHTFAYHSIHLCGETEILRSYLRELARQKNKRDEYDWGDDDEYC